MTMARGATFLVTVATVALTCLACTGPPAGTAVTVATQSGVAPAASETVSEPEPNVQRTPVVRVRTDPDGQGLVADYNGGCEHAVAMTLRESAERVDATADLSLPTPVDGMVTCPTVGWVKSVGARLSAPLGDRALFSGGVQIFPFDGASLRRPRTLPVGFRLVRETGGTSVLPQEDLYRTSSWSRFYAQAPVDAPVCEPARGQLEISQGPVDSFLSADPGDLQPITRDGLTVRTGVDRRNGDRLMTFQDDAGLVALAARHKCFDDEILGEDDLFDVAMSLSRP